MLTLEEEESPKKIILASSSPRRKKILGLLKLDFETIEPGDCAEKIFRNPNITVRYNSLIKAQNVYNNVKINGLCLTNMLIAGFDTIVYLGRQYLGKPCNIEEACDFLKILSGRTHRVISGVSVLSCKTGRCLSDHEVTEVYFKRLDSLEIESYLKKEYVLDKAGAYDIYGFGAILVKKINGCFYNVAGLPVFKFINLLEKFEYNIFR